METWLKNSLELVHRSCGNVKDIDYKILAFIFYEHFSDRNLSQFIGTLYGFDEMKVYHEIGSILYAEYDPAEISHLMQLLMQNGYDNWKDSEGHTLP